MALLIYRDKVAVNNPNSSGTIRNLSFAQSPLTTLYGFKNNILIAPFQLVNQPVEALPFGVFVDKPVLTRQGAMVGSIKYYDWPPARPGSFFDLDPVVRITPAPGFEDFLSQNRISDWVPDITSSLSFDSSLVGEEATFEIASDQPPIIGGTLLGGDTPPLKKISGIVKSLETVVYRRRVYRINAIKIDFQDQLITPQMYGSRVLVDGGLLGMLFYSDKDDQGNTIGYVYPGDRI
ncbi:MAG: hypothetical protein AAF959_08200 [Cyanobacteria bacterium P01_D01_bin.56]